MGQPSIWHRALRHRPDLRGSDRDPCPSAISKRREKNRPRVKDPLGSRTAPERLQAVYRSGKIGYGQYPIGVRLRRFFLHVRRNTQPRARNLSDPHAMDRRPVLSV